MIRCVFSENSNGQKIVIATFVGNDDSGLREIWAESLCNHACKLVRQSKIFSIRAKWIVNTVNEILRDRKLVGMAKLHEGDVFDQKKGITIARQDLKNRYKRAEKLLEKKLFDRIRKDLQHALNRSKYM